MSAEQQRASDEIDLVSVLGSVRRWLPKLLLVTALAGAVTFVVLTMMAPQFASEAELSMTARATDPFPNARANAGGREGAAKRLDKEAINTHVKALQAPELLLRVAKKLQLAEEAEFNRVLGSIDPIDRVLRMAGVGRPDPNESVEERVLSAIKARLSVVAARESRYISIKFKSANPKLAADFANILARTYRASLVEAPVRETSGVVAALEPKIKELNKEVIAAESAVEKFRATSGQFKTGGPEGSVRSRKVATLTQELTKAETALAEARSNWETAIALARSGSADALPDVQKSVVIQNLISQRVRLERHVSEASATLLPRHPRMRQLRADLAGLKRSIAREVAIVVRGLEKSVRVARARVEAIKRQLGTAKSEVVASSGDEAKLKALELAAASKRAELKRLQQQMEDNKTLVVTKTVPVEAQIVSQARATGVPVFPKKGPMTGLVMAAVFMLGLAFAIAREVGTHVKQARGEGQLPGSHVPQAGEAFALAGSTPPPSSYRPAAVPAQSGRSSRSFLDADPALDPDAGDHQDEASDAARPVVAEAPAASKRVAKFAKGGGQERSYALEGTHLTVRELASEIAGSSAQAPSTRTMIVGGDDKLDVRADAEAVVRAMADAGAAVLFVDFALAGGADAGLSDEAPAGLTELISGEASFEDVIGVLPGSTAHVISAGRGLSPTFELEADDINMLLDALDEAYAQIVVSGPYGDCQTLFEVIQGRFDIGVTVHPAGATVPMAVRDTKTFLGFEVTDIVTLDVVRNIELAAESRRFARTRVGAA